MRGSIWRRHAGARSCAEVVREGEQRTGNEWFGLFLTLLFLSLACAKKLSELEPYPCANDGSSCAGTTVPSGDGGTVTVDAGTTPSGVFLCQRGEQKEEK